MYWRYTDDSVDGERFAAVFEPRDLPVVAQTERLHHISHAANLVGRRLCQNAIQKALGDGDSDFRCGLTDSVESDQIAFACRDEVCLGAACAFRPSQYAVMFTVESFKKDRSKLA